MRFSHGTRIIFDLEGQGLKQYGTYVSQMSGGDFHNKHLVISDSREKFHVDYHRVWLAPRVGLFANEKLYTDVKPFEIVEIRSDKKIMVRSMTAKKDPNFKLEQVVGGFSAYTVNNEDQTWLYGSDPDAPVISIRLNKAGWRDADGSRFYIETSPRRYFDYNF